MKIRKKYQNFNLIYIAIALAAIYLIALAAGFKKITDDMRFFILFLMIPIPVAFLFVYLFSTYIFINCDGIQNHTLFKKTIIKKQDIEKISVLCNKNINHIEQIIICLKEGSSVFGLTKITFSKMTFDLYIIWNAFKLYNYDICIEDFYN